MIKPVKADPQNEKVEESIMALTKNSPHNHAIDLETRTVEDLAETRPHTKDNPLQTPPALANPQRRNPRTQPTKRSAYDYKQA